jgi:ribonuclease-3
MGNPESRLMELLRSQEPDINRIIPLFISRFNAAYGDPNAVRWDIRKEDWQRYEFLGDRVLSLVLAQTLFVQRDEVLTEGAMTERLALLVSNRSLDALIRDSGKVHLLIPASIGEQNCYGERITAGAFEAFIGCLYCEVGLDDVAFFLNAVFAGRIAGLTGGGNAIGALQEYFQKRGEPLPVYEETWRAGPDHCPVFTVRVTLPDGRSYDGTGASLAEARKNAAQEALARICPGC